jgi:hypothetical protein
MTADVPVDHAVTVAQLTAIASWLSGSMCPARSRVAANAGCECPLDTRCYDERVLVRRAAFLRMIGTAVIASGTVACATTPPPPPATAAEPQVAPAPAPEKPAEPAALPFHMPCGSDDAPTCQSGCTDGFIEDCVTLGAMYMAGTAVALDKDRGIELLQRACSRDSARGCMRLADAYHAEIATPPSDGTTIRDPHAEEVTLYRRACDGGANQGCVLAGRALVAGHGLARDPGVGAHLFGQVCDRGNAEACLELGKLLRQGEGLKRDLDRAGAMFRKACGLGLAEGCVLADAHADRSR